MQNSALFVINLLALTGGTWLCRALGEQALLSWITLQAMLANMFVLKQIILFGLPVTASDALMVSSTLSLAYLRQDYGHARAKTAITAVTWTLVIYAGVVPLHIAYQPSAQDVTQAAYHTLFDPNFRIIFSSICAYWLGQRVNIALLKLSAQYTRWPPGLSTVIAVGSAQAVDTTVFASLALFGLIQQLWPIIGFSLSVKYLTLLTLHSMTLWPKYRFKNRRNARTPIA